jgi:hypothetical protein
MKRIGKYKIDFVIPLHRYNLLFPSVIEAVVEYYTPRTIYIITSITEIEKLTEQVSQWKTKETKILYINEETFFQLRYHKSLEKIKKWYTLSALPLVKDPTAVQEKKGTRPNPWQQLMKG